MTKSEILKLCDQNKFKGFKAPPYWNAEIYGFGKWIRKYGFYPSFLPLCISTDHGPPLVEKPLRIELDSTAPYQFYHSPRFIIIWRKFSKKLCFVLYSPFVFYRRKYNITRLPDAKGTIVFPAHTTRSIDDQSNIEAYIKQLLLLPKEFHPISVCLYHDDIMKKKYEIYMRYKIPIYTAGYYFDERFTERFYNILKNFKYASSNTIGSYLFYSIEMGIPFSIYGEKHDLINKGDPNFKSKKYDLYKESEFYRKVFNMFNGLNTEITTEQFKLTEETLGLEDGASRLRMSIILYIAFVRWLFSFAFFSWLIKIVKEIFKKTKE